MYAFFKKKNKKILNTKRSNPYRIIKVLPDTSSNLNMNVVAPIALEAKNFSTFFFTLVNKTTFLIKKVLINVFILSAVLWIVIWTILLIILLILFFIGIISKVDGSDDGSIIF